MIAIAIAQKREEVCLGGKLLASESDSDKNFGVKLIPLKAETFTLNATDSLGRIGRG